MTPQEMDAFVQIVSKAIDKRIAEVEKRFETEQRRTLIQVAKAAVKTDAELWAKALDEKVKRLIAEIPPAKDGEGATPEQIAEAVSVYMESHPITAPEPLAPTAEAIGAEVAKYLQENPPEVQHGKDATPEQVSKAVSEFMEANPVQPPEPLEPTAEAIMGQVQKYLQENPPKDGERGLDAVQIEILPSISESKRYTKGTYARWNGGLVRAYRDTDIGKDALSCGWEIVLNGVSDVQVHQLDGGEFAIKTLMTSGQSNIVKAVLPTMEYKGVWKESHGEYSKGHTVTQNGSLWHCNQKTTDKPGTSDAWTLCAKRGTDGKDVSVVKMRPDTYSIKGDK